VQLDEIEEAWGIYIEEGQYQPGIYIWLGVILLASFTGVVWIIKRDDVSGGSGIIALGLSLATIVVQVGLRRA
jgi:hypothetical protein